MKKIITMYVFFIFNFVICSQDIQYSALSLGNSHIIEFCSWKDENSESPQLIFTHSGRQMYHRDYSTVERLLKNPRLDVNQRGLNNFSYLHYVTASGDDSIVGRILKHGADVNTLTDEGWSPLHIAAIKGHDRIAKMLLEKKANVNQLDNKGFSPLLYAYYQGHVKVVEVLLQSPQLVRDTDKLDKEKYLPIHIAVVKNDTTMLQLLLKSNKVDVNKQFFNGLSFLHVAVCKGYLEMARLLLENGANVNLKNDDGVVPLHAAILKEDVEMVKCLLEYNPDTMLKTNDGQTVHDLAKDFGYQIIGKSFVKIPQEAEQKAPKKSNEKESQSRETEV